MAPSPAGRRAPSAPDRSPSRSSRPPIRSLRPAPSAQFPDTRRDRAARTGPASRSGLLGEGEVSLGDVAERELADVVAALKSRDAGCSPSNADGSTARSITAL